MYRITVIVLLLLAFAGTVRADSPLPTLHNALTSGGGTITVGGYTMTSSIGQPWAGTLQAGEYWLTSGVIPSGPAQATERLFLPIVQR